MENPVPGAQVWFTDGSKQSNMDTGARVYGPRFQRAIPMGKFPSIFQAEIFAICVCVGECLKRGTRRADIYILSDSQAALMALSNYEVTSALALDCIVSLNHLGTHNRVTLIWVPGHEGHMGNERADCLANCGARRPFIGPEPFCGVPFGYIREKVKNWGESEFATYGAQSAGQRQAKNFISISAGKSRKLMSLSTNELRIVTNFLTLQSQISTV